MALAIKAVNLLLEYTPQKKIKNALNNLHLPARAEVISHKPVRIIDGAHTPLSISMVVDTIKSNFAYKKALLVFGANIDKEIKKMLKILLPRFNIAIFTKANTPRAASPEYIIKIAKNMRRETICHTTENVPEAIKKAEGILQKNNLLLITGSFYVAGDAIKYYKETGSYEAEI
jgi:dihydrofolate synthase/folylpolyglutamate synthase